MASIRELRLRQNDFSAELAQKGWYHSFELPDGSRIEGCMSLDWERERWSRFGLPEDLGGKRVLDIGAWDGWFSFEAERRRATVTSIDCVEAQNYLRMHRRLGSRADYRIIDLYDLPRAGLGQFEVVFCLGVLYHLKHPLLGLEIVCSLASEVAYVETFVIDGETWSGDPGGIPVMEFYEGVQLNGQFDNWTGPSVECLLALCRAAGFARVELLAVDRSNALVACHRKWEPVPDAPAQPAPELVSAVNAVDFGINIRSRRDEYLGCWFRAPGEVVRGDLRAEVGGYGAPAVHLHRESEGAWVATFRIPPGMPAGWTDVRLRLADSLFGEARRIAIDMPLAAERIAVKDLFDAASWTRGQAHANLACWVQGLPENADVANVRLWIGGDRLRTTWVGEPDCKGYRQVNAAMPPDIAPGDYGLRVECGGAASDPAPLKVL